jgi:hypothetical protein
MTKSLEDNVKKLGPAFSNNFSVDDGLAKYVLCVEKLDFKASDTDPTESVLDKFADHVVLGIDNALKRSRHFVRGEDHFMQMHDISSRG